MAVPFHKYVHTIQKYSSVKDSVVRSLLNIWMIQLSFRLKFVFNSIVKIYFFIFGEVNNPFLSKIDFRDKLIIKMPVTNPTSILKFSKTPLTAQYMPTYAVNEHKGILFTYRTKMRIFFFTIKLNIFNFKIQICKLIAYQECPCCDRY